MSFVTNKIWFYLYEKSLCLISCKGEESQFIDIKLAVILTFDLQMKYLGGIFAFLPFGFLIRNLLTTMNNMRYTNNLTATIFRNS